MKLPVVSKACLAYGASALFILGSTGLASAQQTWQLATIYPESNFHTENDQAFAERVEEETGGEVSIEVRAGGQLGFKGPEMMRSVGQGLVDMADMPTNLQVGNAEILNLQTLPFTYPTMDDYQRFWEIFQPTVAEIARDNNQKLLYVVAWPPTKTYTSEKIDNLDDFRDKSLRVSDPLMESAFNRIGVNAVLLPWEEAVPALASGAVDTVETSAASGVDGQFWDFLDFVYPTHHRWSTEMVTVNLDSWNELSEENQDTIEQIAEEMQPKFWERAKAADQESISVLQENGMSLVEPSEELMTQMREQSAEFVSEKIDSYGSEAESIMEEYESSQ